jgi:hypothetical protein
MDSENHKNTWNNFTKFVLWGTVAVILSFSFNGNIFIIILKFFDEFSFYFRK